MDSIKLTWLGHSCFVAEAEGYKICFDPYSNGSVPGVELHDIEANEVICSHEHGDHNYREAVKLIPGGINPFKTTTLHSFHDEDKGAKRGKNDITILEYKGIRVAHLGDIGCYPAPDQIDELKGLDAVMVPVGGHFTMEPADVTEFLKAIGPKVVIPMHFRSENAGLTMIGTLDDFLKGREDIVRHQGNAVEITKDTPAQTAVLELVK